MMLPKMDMPKATINRAVPTSFITMVHHDIQRCETFSSEAHDEKEAAKFHSELISKYHAYIDDFDSTLYGYNYVAHAMDIDLLGFNSIVVNIESMKYKLIAFEANGCRNMFRESNNAGGNINIENTLSSVQTQSVIIDFDVVKKQVESMPGLSEKETEETLDKISEIKAIVELKESQKSKWQKLKPILAWIADKSVDVGLALLPLLLKIQL